MSEFENELLKRRIETLEEEVLLLKQLLMEWKDEMDWRFEEHEDDFVHAEKPVGVDEVLCGEEKRVGSVKP